MEITVTPEERSLGRLSPEHLARAVSALLEHGFVILANAVDPAHLDLLRERMEADSQTLIAAERWGGAGRIAGHLQQGAPPFAPYVFGDVVANPFAIEVTSEVLGAGVYNSFYNGNANSPGSGVQPLHRDGDHLWPGLPLAHPPHRLVINIALVDVGEENGSTELWPGSHVDTVAGKTISPEQEEARRAQVPPLRANTRKGDLLLRDIRLWHRGMPNRSQRVRHMLAMIHNVGWLQRPEPLLFGSGCEEAFAGDFDHHVEFSDGPIEYLHVRAPRRANGSKTA